MKTIKAFLIGIFTLVLSVASMGYSVAVVSNATTIYYQYNQTDPTTFTSMFVFVSICLFALGLQLMLWSLASFKLFIKYHDMYLDGKRDRQIKSQLRNETYKELYKRLSSEPNIDRKHDILDTFYKKEEEPKHNPINFDDFINKMMKQ